MKKIARALVFAGAAGLVAACSAEPAHESGAMPEKTGAPAVSGAVADVAEAAEGMSTEMHTLTFTVDGMS